MKRTTSCALAALSAAAVFALTAGAAGPATGGISQSPASASTEWGYGGDVRQIRYSPLQQINRGTVQSLAVAWTYDTGEPGALQTQPVVVDGTVYGWTPSHKLFALDANTGVPRWTFDSGLPGGGPNRGVMFWRGSGETRIVAAVGDFMYAIDAQSGRPIASFGANGRIDLREHLGRPPETQNVRLTTPGVVYRDLVIIGGRVSEGLPASPGHIRAYDVRTGALRWTFHTIPHPGEFGSETWPKEAWTYSGGANSWAGMALDEARGVVYVPTGSAASDFYGADRVGDNLFANSLIALDAATGKRLWHFQTVRHDIWDRDLPSPPSLVTVRHSGRTIDAVAQATKHGYLFLFDRATGEPLFPIEYRPYPSSTVPGEVTSPAQPIPTRPRPFARQRLTADLLSTRTPAIAAWARKAFDSFVSDGQFVPLAVGKDTVFFPGYDGGAEWGGQAFDPDTGLYYVNANDLAWTGGLVPNTGGFSGRALYLQHCATCHRDDRGGAPPSIPSLIGIGDRRSFAEVASLVRQGVGRMPGRPDFDQTTVNAIVQYTLTGEDDPPRAAGRSGAAPEPPTSPLINNNFRFTGYRRFMDPDGFPAVAPPWGTLNAIDLNTGEYAWTVPLGEYPELVRQGLRNTGSENYGGPVVTAGGLVFIGATNADRKFRAFDKANGKLLWETVMGGPGRATPATYEAGGRQFVVIATGGAGGGRGAAAAPATPADGQRTAVYVAFALPR